MMKEKPLPKFSVRPATVGEGYLIDYLPPGAPPMQINNLFDTEDEAKGWIARESADWLHGVGGP